MTVEQDKMVQTSQCAPS